MSEPSLEAQILEVLDEEEGEDRHTIAGQLRHQFTPAQITSALSRLHRKGEIYGGRWRETFVWWKRRKDPMPTPEEIDELYPEHAKLRKVSEETQAIGLFCDNSRYVLCELMPETAEMHPYYRPVSDIQGAIAEHYGIDLKAIDREKAAMLAKIRASNP